MSDRKNKLFIAYCVVGVIVIITSIITLCLYGSFAGGIDRKDIKIYVDGNLYSNAVEVSLESSHEIVVKAESDIDYYICIDSEYGYVTDNKTVHINSGLKPMTIINLRLALIKDNYAVSEYVCQLLVEPI